VIGTIKKLAKHFSYRVELIKISDIIQSRVDVEFDKSNDYERVMKLMDAGNQIRSRAGDNAILAKMSSVEILRRRPVDSDNRVIYVLDSLKHPEEVNALRDIYGTGFYLFAVHSSEAQRDHYLRKSCHISTKAKRQELIVRDKDEEVGYGQSTRSAFHLADFFLTEDGDQARVWNALERYFDLIFGDPFRTPTFQEYAMFMAHAASARSADLSRQVGAVITRNNDIISSGANDCPTAFGGTYWPLFDPVTNEIYDQDDGRDYMRGEDRNATEKAQMITKLRKGLPEDALAQFDKNVKDSGLGDITEYGRVVHAEMDAILGCARRNERIEGATMYATTYPCHNCAKHIVAAGIERVIYIEPYPKSKALEMHTDAITTEGKDAEKMVLFRPFIGVGPRQYINLFSMNLSIGSQLKRKQTKSGAMAKWERKTAVPRVKMFDKSYREIEELLSMELG